MILQWDAGHGMRRVANVVALLYSRRQVRVSQAKHHLQFGDNFPALLLARLVRFCVTRRTQDVSLHMSAASNSTDSGGAAGSSPNFVTYVLRI
jgi:hypothetical protein